MEIAITSGEKLGISLSPSAAYKVASVSRGTPRIVNKYLYLIRDYAYAENKGIVDESVIDKALTLAGVQENGLTDIDISLLNVLGESDRAIGLSTLAHILGEDPQTIEEVYEPFLLMNQYINVTPKGRELTIKGRDIIGL